MMRGGFYLFLLIGLVTFSATAATWPLLNSSASKGATLDACTEGKVGFSTEVQLPTRVKSQRGLGTCYAQSTTTLVEMYLYRKTGLQQTLSAELAVCDLIANESQVESEKRAQEFRQKYRAAARTAKNRVHFVEGFETAKVLDEIKAGTVRLARDGEGLSDNLRSVLKGLDQAVAGHQLSSQREICSYIKNGERECLPRGSVQVQKIDLNEMQIGRNSNTDLDNQLDLMGRLIEAGEKSTPELRAECRKFSESMRRDILGSLCRGIPVLTSFAVFGHLEVGPVDGSKYTKSYLVPKETGELDTHTVVATGVEIDPSSGTQYFIFRSSDGPDFSKLRIPFDEVCKVFSAAWITSSEDRTRTSSDLWPGSHAVSAVAPPTVPASNSH